MALDLPVVWWRCPEPGCDYSVVDNSSKHSKKHHHRKRHALAKAKSSASQTVDVVATASGDDPVIFESVDDVSGVPQDPEKNASLPRGRGRGRGPGRGLAKAQGPGRGQGRSKSREAKRQKRDPGAGKPKPHLGDQMEDRCESNPKTGYARDTEEHYRHQVGFVNQFAPTPWTRCFGAFGTGFVGVRPAGTLESQPSTDAAGLGGTVDSPDDVDDSGAGAGEASKGFRGAKDRFDIPENSMIFIFVNSPYTRQTRGGKVLGQYKETLDVANRSLHWSGQRSDIHNRKFNTILGHVARGGNVLVAVRASSSCEYVLLGKLSHISGAQGARFLVEDADDVIHVQGTNVYHKAITSLCVNDRLRGGVCLSVVRATAAEGARWCKACCYIPPKCMLNFVELNREGIEAFRGVQLPNAAKPVPESNTTQPQEQLWVPTRRIRVKSSGMMAVTDNVFAPPADSEENLWAAEEDTCSRKRQRQTCDVEIVLPSKQLAAADESWIGVGESA